MDLVITHNLLCTMGGAEKVILEIAKRFDPVAIYVLKYDPKRTYPEFSEFNVVEIGGHNKSFLLGPSAAYHFYRMKIRDDYDVVNAHWPPSHWVRNKNARCVWYCHSPSRAVYDLYDYRRKNMAFPMTMGHYFYSNAYRIIDRRMSSKIDYIFANSNNVKGRILKYLGRDSEVLYPGVDHKKYQCTDYKKYFFLPGRIDPTKRIEFVISAFLLFRKAHPDFELVIAGSLNPKFSGYYEYLRRIFDGKILLNVGYEEMTELYSNSYCVLFAGLNEDFGMTPLESMACSKPVISIDEGGPRETIVDGKTGYLVNNTSSMAEKMAYLSDNPDIVEKMGKEGRRRIMEMFTWDKFLERFDAVCHTVADFSDD